ncbi:hypothetical protein FRC04_004343 [Tulasnella sp. 424]|nr:hypothetical protein FRC04_004343 [Tulasnella sp. 424]KAG8979459.1 hypothetical protein FRC05_008445 [Tulasnella sp. 425]
MSRPYQATKPSFASRMGFEALGVEDLESASESEHELEKEPTEVVSPPPPPPPAPVEEPSPKPAVERQPSKASSSKSAKRAAKKAAAKAVAPPTAATNADPEAAPEEADESVSSPEGTPLVEEKTSGFAEPRPTPANKDATGGTTPVSASLDDVSQPTPQSSGLGLRISQKDSASARARSPLRPVNTITPFQPSLPESLPQPASPGIGPRKRKASQDLKSNPLPKETRLGEKPPKDTNGSLTTVVTETGEKIGVVKLALAPANAVSEEEKAKAKSKQNVFERTVWTLIMIGGFLFLLLAGTPYMILLVMAIQTQVYREVTNLFALTGKNKDEAPIVDDKHQRDPWSKTLNWYFFAVLNYFLYGESMIYYFKHVVYADVRFLPFANNHRFISFMLYVFGFMGFVASLKKQYLRQQFGLFGWVHMSLLVIVVSSHFIVNNILEGIIWLWVPASLVICNDIFAYIWGKLFGRTQLIALSPKKTVEGFVGALFSTIIFGLGWSTFFMRYNYMICPAVDLGVNAWSNIQCDPNPAFVWRTFITPEPIQALISPILRIPPITWAPFQLHTLVMAIFASLVAPFGGFFASGFKRAFNLKDFGDSIPGHGGLTDRMDCQFLMGMFAYVYYSSNVRVHRVTVGSVMQTIVSSLSPEDQLRIFNDLKYYLQGLGQI